MQRNNHISFKCSSADGTFDSINNNVAAETTSAGLLESGSVLVGIVNEPVDLPTESHMAHKELPSTETQDTGLHDAGAPKNSCSDRKPCAPACGLLSISLRTYFVFCLCTVNI